MGKEVLLRVCPELMHRKGSVAEAPTLSGSDGAAVAEAFPGVGKSSVPSSGRVPLLSHSELM